MACIGLIVADGAAQTYTFNPALTGGQWWNVYANNWSTTGATPYTTAWTNGSAVTAVFNPGSGNVVGPNIASNITLNTVRVLSGEAQIIAGGGTAVTFAGVSPTVDVASGSGLRVFTSMTGSEGFNKTGSGDLGIVGDANWSGGTTILAGKLFVGEGGTTGSLTGDVSVANGAALVFRRSDAVTFGGAISGAGRVEKYAEGILYLTGENTFTGGTYLSTGGLAIGRGGATGSITGNIYVVAETTVYFNRNDAVSYGGDISGNGRVDKSWTGTTTLTGNNSYTGGTVVHYGTLKAGSNTAFGATTGPLDIANGAIVDLNGRAISIGALSGGGNITNTAAGAVVLTAGNDGTTSFYDGVIGSSGGSIALTKAGAGLLYLTGDNTFTGGVAVSGGGLVIGRGGATGSITGDITAGAGTNVYFNRDNAVTFGGSISGAGQVDKSWTGTTTLTGNNNYTGGTVVHYGTLKAGSNTAFGAATGRLDVATGATVDLNGQAISVGNFTGEGTVTNTATAVATLTAGNGVAGTTTFVGSITQAAGAGNLSLTKSGVGSLTLAGTTANTFTGLTTVSAGTLVLGKTVGVNAVGGNVTVSGGTLRLAVANQIPNSSTLTLNGGTFSTGSGSGGFSETMAVLALTASSTIALDTGTGRHDVTFGSIAASPTGTLNITGWTNDGTGHGANGRLMFTFSDASANAALLSHVQFSGYNLGQAQFIGTSGNYELVPVPEPSSILGVSAAALGFAGWVRRRRADRSAARRD